MNEKEMAKYALVIGFALTFLGFGMLAIPAVQSAGDIVVDTSPPSVKSAQPPQSSTSNDPRMLNHEVYPKDSRGNYVAFGLLYAEDTTSKIDTSTFSITCTNVTDGTTVYSITGQENFSKTYTSKDGTTAWAGERIADYFDDRDGDGKLELPRGTKYRFDMSVKDRAGNELDVTCWSKVKQSAPGGDWFINGRSWSEVKYITSNSIDFKFKATTNADVISSAKVDIDTQGGKDVKEVTLSETSADTYTGSTTLSDGKYTVKGIVNGNTLAQVNIPLNSPTPDYGEWLAYGLTGVGLLSLLGGAWKITALA